MYMFISSALCSFKQRHHVIHEVVDLFVAGDWETQNIKNRCKDSTFHEHKRCNWSKTFLIMQKFV